MEITPVALVLGDESFPIGAIEGAYTPDDLADFLIEIAGLLRLPLEILEEMAEVSEDA